MNTGNLEQILYNYANSHKLVVQRITIDTANNRVDMYTQDGKHLECYVYRNKSVILKVEGKQVKITQGS